MIPHHRIHQHQRVRAAEGAKKFLHHADLLRAAQIARIQRVKSEVLLLPMAKEGAQIVGEVPERVALKTAGMGGQNGRGNAAELHTHGRKNGQRHGEGAAAKAAQILYRRRLQRLFVACHARSF